MPDPGLPAARPPVPPPQPLCASGALAERGLAYGWEVQQWGRPVRAFALRIDGRVVAYLNRCVHVPTEMDWQPGEFLDMDRRYILCSIHGAHYEPETGRCAAGPCGRGRLTPIETRERDGQVWWLPSADIRPMPEPTPPPPPPPPSTWPVDPVAAPGSDASPASPASPGVPDEPA
jgi:nitrite reductase/ring-hydroxylating ferredoxin subunit